MKKRLKRFCGFYITTLIIFLTSTTAYAAGITPYKGYHYNSWGESVPAPNGYYPEKVIYGRDIGLDSLKTPTDIFAAGEQSLYILDSGNARIVILDAALKPTGVIDRFVSAQGEEKLNTPSGIFVDKKGRIYIADKGNARILVCDQTGKISNIIGAPKSKLIPKGFNYMPSKVIVDDRGMIYVLSENAFQGFLTFDISGNFKGFFGSNRVEVTPAMLAQRFWKRLMTREQRDATAQFTPIEYSNMTINSSGFIYACVKNTRNSTDEIKKINAKGNDVLGSTRTETLHGNNYGDIEWNIYRGKKTDTTFVDVAVDAKGYFCGLDVERGRVFQYDENSNLLFVFGNKGSQAGAFEMPAAIEAFQDKILVLDSAKGCITSFALTPFGSSVRKAMDLYNDGQYPQSMDPWRQVLKMDSNYELAYRGMGKAELMLGNYSQAMKCFKLGNDRTGYSNALSEYRMMMVRDYFSEIVLMLAAFILLCVAVVNRKKVFALTASAVTGHRVYVNDSGEKRLPYPVHVMFHPFEGFEEMKYHREYSTRTANGIFLCYFLFSVVSSLENGFQFSTTRLEQFNILSKLAVTLGPFVLWAITNWCLCTLMDGEGKLKEIWVASAYALMPMVITMLPLTLISNFMIIEERAFIDMVNTVVMVWTGLLLFLGIKAVHQYTVKKTVFCILLTLFGMAIVIFLGVLVFSLFQQLFIFLNTIYNEIIYRM